jgi:hypothetical protein
MKAKKDWGMAQVIGYLSSKSEALSSNPSTIKTKQAKNFKIMLKGRVLSPYQGSRVPFSGYFFPTTFNTSVALEKLEGAGFMGTLKGNTKSIRISIANQTGSSTG